MSNNIVMQVGKDGRVESTSVRPGNGLYTLKNGKPVPEPDIDKWAEWFGKRNLRRLRRTVVRKSPEIFVSTVFLGIDHSFGGTPVLWETMIFGGANDQYQERYSSRAAAIAGHKKAVGLAKQKHKP